MHEPHAVVALPIHPARAPAIPRAGAKIGHLRAVAQWRASLGQRPLTTCKHRSFHARAGLSVHSLVPVRASIYISICAQVRDMQATRLLALRSSTPAIPTKGRISAFDFGSKSIFDLKFKSNAQFLQTGCSQ